MIRPGIGEVVPAEPFTAPRLGRFETVLRACTALTMLGVMIVISADVIGRYFFASPITGSYEIVQVLLGLVFFSALPLTTQSGAHVNISILDAFLHDGLRRVQSLVMLLLGALIMSGICLQLWKLGESLSRNRRALGVLEIPLAPVVFAYSALGVLTVLVYVLMIVRASREMWARRGSGR